MKTPFETILSSAQKLHLQQVYEGFEILIGVESKNKYRIFDENMNQIAYAAEVSTGIMAAISRQFLKHWRSFEMNIYDTNKQLMYTAKFPFRFLFKTLYLHHGDGKVIGHLQQRFAIFSKKFSVHDERGSQIAEIKSALFKVWTFEFKHQGKKLGAVEKKWSGGLTEVFTDRDNFVVNYTDPMLSLETKQLMLATCLMIDIIYFENNQASGSPLGLIK